MSRFEFDSRWFEEELFQSSDLLDILEEGGQRVVAEARSIASQYNRSGDFERSIQGELLRAKNGRPFYRVWSDDPAAWSIEFGTAKTPAHRVLGRAIGKWQDAATHNGAQSKRLRRKAKVEKSIQEWASKVRG